MFASAAAKPIFSPLAFVDCSVVKEVRTPDDEVRVLELPVIRIIFKRPQGLLGSPAGVV